MFVMYTLIVITSTLPSTCCITGHQQVVGWYPTFLRVLICK